MNLLSRGEDIILTGMPGCGKSTLGSKLAYEVGYNFSDFDDDVLEKITLEVSEEAIGVLNLSSTGIIPEDFHDKKVSHLLELLGDDAFLDLEGFIGENLQFDKPTIISTSGSLPLKVEAMDNLRKKGKVIHINTPIKSIIERLEQMQTNRIIGMGKMTLEEILEYRKDFYNKTMDYNFDVKSFDKENYEGQDYKKIVKLQKSIIFGEFMDFIKNK